MSTKTAGTTYVVQLDHVEEQCPRFLVDEATNKQDIGDPVVIEESRFPHHIPEFPRETE